MSLTVTGKFTLGGTLVEDTTSVSTFADMRIYNNESTYIGSDAGKNNLYGVRNTILGYQAGLDSRLGGNNVILGSYAGKNLNGQNNVVIGSDTGRLLNLSHDNIVIGKNTLQRVGECKGNIAIGSSTGYNLNGGDFNVLIGHYVFTSGYETSISNTIIGSFSDGKGSYNNAFGENNRVVGSNNILLGNKNTCGTDNSVVLGYGNSNIGKNSIIIGNNIKNTDGNVVNINNQIMSHRSGILSIYNDVGRSCGINFGERSIDVFASSNVNVKCPILFEDTVVSTRVMDVNTLNIAAVCCMSSNIEIKSDGTVFWKIGLTNKTVDSSDLSFISKNKTVMTITDEFQPEILNFTGKHRCKLLNNADGELKIGMVVVATGEYCNLEDERVVGIDESIPIVKISSERMDARAFGVLCALESDADETRDFNIGNIRFSVEKLSPRIIVNSVGEGAIMVCGENGSIRNGDFLTTSGRSGYAMKQQGGQYMNYTIAKATCDCVFQDIQDTQMIGCTYKF